MSDFDELLKIQRRMEKKISEERDTDDTIEVLMIMGEISPNNQPIQKEQILVEGQIRGLSEERINSMIEKLKNDRLIFMPRAGWLQRR